MHRSFGLGSRKQDVGIEEDTHDPISPPALFPRLRKHRLQRRLFLVKLLDPFLAIDLDRECRRRSKQDSLGRGLQQQNIVGLEPEFGSHLGREGDHAPTDEGHRRFHGCRISAKQIACKNPFVEGHMPEWPDDCGRPDAKPEKHETLDLVGLNSLNGFNGRKLQDDPAMVYEAPCWFTPRR